MNKVGSDFPIADRIQADLTIGHAEDVELTPKIPSELLVLEDVRRGVEAQGAQELTLLTENELAHPRVDPVGPHEQIRSFVLAIAQKHVYVLLCLLRFINSETETH